MTLHRPSLLLAGLLSSTAALAQSAQLGKGLSGKGLGGDPKVMQFELDLLKAVNELRKTKKLAPLLMDDALRRFARAQAELGARGDPAAATADARLKAQNLAPHGYRLQYAYGTKAAQVMTDVKKDDATTGALLTELGKIGVGAFWVPDEKPYFQVAFLVAVEPDPMAGKTGLSREQTDPVMAEAAAVIKSNCYDPALRSDPNLAGNLIFQLVIGTGGKVTEVKLLSGTGRDSFDGCATGIIRGLTFPEPYKGRPVTLNHPMRFSPPQGEKRVGSLSPGQISKVFHLTQANIKQCYDDRLAEKPKLRGLLLLHLVVTPDGRIKNVTVKEDGPNDEALTRCVLGFVNKLAFPPPDFGGEAEVEYPLTFEPPKSSP